MARFRQFTLPPFGRVLPGVNTFYTLVSMPIALLRHEWDESLCNEMLQRSSGRVRAGRVFASGVNA
jgi:hypothetical protein